MSEKLTIPEIKKRLPLYLRFEACQPCRERHEICRLRDGDIYTANEALSMDHPDDCMCVLVPAEA